MDVYKEFQMECAHLLPKVPPGHKCGRLHGHSYRVAVVVDGPLGAESGWVMDFGEIKAAFAAVKDALDHRYLNEIPGLENPTAEHIAIWIWRQLKSRLPALSEIRIDETCTAGCIYRGE